MAFHGKRLAVIRMGELRTFADQVHHAVLDTVPVHVLGNLLHAQQIRLDLVDQGKQGFTAVDVCLQRAAKIFYSTPQVQGHDA